MDSKDKLFALTINYIQRLTLPLGDSDAYRAVYWGEPQRSLLIACEQGLENHATHHATSVQDYKAMCHKAMVAWRDEVNKYKGATTE